MIWTKTCSAGCEYWTDCFDDKCPQRQQEQIKTTEWLISRLFKRPKNARKGRKKKEVEKIDDDEET